MNISNKTQRGHAEKTELGLKASFVAVITSLIVVLLLIFLPHTQAVLRVGDQRFNLSVASTGTELEKGLSGRSSLAKNQGMLFIFPNSAVQCFWMKDTHFPLDITWLSTTKKVLYIQPNVSPKSYPHTYCPPVLARYVIELNSGVTTQTNIIPGMTLQF